jgi:nicotinate phosphoribosyltransferase
MSTALFTDHYELTMLRAALRSGAARRRVLFEVFTRALPAGRRYGVLAGTGRLLAALAEFTFGPAELEPLLEHGVVDPDTADYLAGYRFAGDIHAFAEGEPYLADTPVLTVEGTFGECVILETLVLSVLNHDSAVAAAGSRMVTAAAGRPCIEMGTRRAHEQAAVAAARAAYLVGFSATSNLEAGRRWRVPTAGTSAHAFTLVHPSESDAFAAQVAVLGAGTTLLVDTFDVAVGVERAVAVAGADLGAVRIDSGDLAAAARAVRAQLDRLGAAGTRIVATGDLDEHSIARLAAEPVDGFGVGTRLVTGSGAPTAGFVYKLVEVDGTPVAKTSVGKATRGGRKAVVRRHDADGVAFADVVLPGVPAAPGAGAGHAGSGAGAGVGRGRDAAGPACERPAGAASPAVTAPGVIAAAETAPAVTAPAVTAPAVTAPAVTAAGETAAGETAVDAAGGPAAGGRSLAGGERPLLVPLMLGGEPVDESASGPSGLERAREHHRAALADLPPDALEISFGGPCIPVVRIGGTPRPSS